MSIKHIWEKFEELQEYIAWKSAISSIFTGWIMAGKPYLQATPWEPYLYFDISSNNPIVDSERIGKNILEKEAIMDFYLIFPSAWTPHVDIYAALNTISNNICEKWISLWDVKVSEIIEWNQTGVIREENETPFIFAQYRFFYESF